ncbi:hypothetical protein V6Z11_D06G141000 [Gossypium hirsutum]
MAKLVATFVVVLIRVLFSFMQNLGLEKEGLEKEMIYSIFKAFLLLSVIGFVLQFIFNQDNMKGNKSLR